MKKIIRVVLAIFICTTLTFAGFKIIIHVDNTNFRADLRTPKDKLIDSEALKILCDNSGNFAVLDTFLKDKGYVRVQNKGGLELTGASQSNLNITMERYVYQGYTPLQEKVFIHFDWVDWQWDNNPGSPDDVGIAWDDSKFQDIGSAYTAYSFTNTPLNNNMWLADPRPSGYVWSLYEPKNMIPQCYNGVDHGAAVITLKAKSNDLNTGNMYGKYLHTFNTTNVSFTAGLPDVINVTWASGSDYWRKGIVLYSGQ